MSKLSMNPWATMWKSPRQTVRYLVENKVAHGFYTLSFICGLPLSFQIVELSTLGAAMSFGGAVLVTLLLAPIFGAAWLSILSALILWTGKLLKGKGSFSTIRCATAWSHIVTLFSLIGTVLLLVAFKGLAFTNGIGGATLSAFESVILFVTVLLPCIALVWGVVLMLNSIAEVQKYSLWKALVNCILAGVVFLVAVQLVFGLLGLV